MTVSTTRWTSCAQPRYAALVEVTVEATAAGAGHSDPKSNASWLDSTSTAAQPDMAGTIHSMIPTGVRRAWRRVRSHAEVQPGVLGARDACHLLVREIGQPREAC